MKFKKRIKLNFPKSLEVCCSEKKDNIPVKDLMIFTLHKYTF